MATKRKVRRFDEGGMTEEEVASFAGSPENDSNAGMAEAYEEPKPEKKLTFKEAFAAARNAGNKTFEWNGKKFAAELAGEKKAAPKATPKAEPKAKYETSYDRSRREDREAGRDFDSLIGKLKNKFTGEDTRKPLPLKSTKSETGNKFMGSTGLKKGGSVSSASRRGDGIASKGKTKGRMV